MANEAVFTHRSLERDALKLAQTVPAPTDANERSQLASLQMAMRSDYGKGEVCAAGSRLLVDRSIKNEFMDKVVARTKKILRGDYV